MGRLTRQALFLTIEKASHLAGAMILLIGVARLSGQDTLATYAYVIAITSVFVPLLDLGLNTRIIREVASGDASAAVGQAISFKIRFGAFSVLTMIACSWFADKSTEVVVSVFLVGLSTWAMSLGDVFNAVFKGLQRSHTSALLIGGTYLCLTGLALSAILAGWGVPGIALVYMLCRFGFMGVAWLLVRRLGPQARAPFRWHAVLAGVPFMPAVFFVGVLLNLNFIIADSLGEATDSGLYAIGYRVASALFVLVSASLEGVLPAMVKAIASRNGLHTLILRCCGLFFLGGLVCVIAVHVFGPWAVVRIFGEPYAGAAKALAILSWTLPPVLVCAGLHTAFLAIGLEKEAFFWMLGLVGLGALLGALGFAWDGAAGTALAPALSGWVSAVGMGWRIRLHFRQVP
ncbi:MAG: hypothetical protein O3B73_12110 [bacterium]|nr:hypothetical protein [bacterium]